MYLGIGRSPVPIMAYLQTEKNTLVRNIPLTNFQYRSRHKPLTSEEEEKLYQHFDKLLPVDAESDGREKNLIVDLAFSGATICDTKYYLNQYIEARQRKTKEIRSLAITATSLEEELKQNHPTFDVFSLAGNQSTITDAEKFDHFLMMMAAKMYKDKAEYTWFDIKHPEEPKIRPAYQEYVREMRLAKSKHTLGLLNDDWTNAAFEIFKNDSEYSPLINLLRYASTNQSSDAEASQAAKDIISEIVSQKRHHSIASE